VRICQTLPIAHALACRFNGIVVVSGQSGADGWYRLLVAHSVDAIALLGADGEILFVSPPIERLTGYRPVDLMGTSAFDSIHPEDLAGVRETFQRVLRTQEPVRIEYRARHKDGSWRRRDCVGLNALDNRDIGAIIVNYRDTSAASIAEAALLALEQRFVQTAKMEAVGRFAGGIAHDFNNYLTAIISYAELAVDQAGDADALRRDLDEVRKAAASAAALTRQLLAFSRKQLLQPQVLDLNAVVGGMTAMLRRLIGADIELRAVADGALDPISANPSQIEQVIMNLALNARDAMPHGGVLAIETANVDLDEAFAAAHPGASSGPHVMLAISDTGEGMDRDVQEHLFEPFYTTKAPGRGTGLGLATVYGIVKQSGGSVFVYSEKGLGTTFKIFLPRSPELVESPPDSADSSAALRGDETILIVEDQPEVRSVVCSALARHGYQVLTATDGNAALAVAMAHGAPIDLLITDVVMPGVGARELADRFRRHHPRAAVIYMSGYTNDNVVQRGIVEDSVAFLQKPFSPAALLTKVREVLNE
jgi:two-component system cell cycle sensor histidine kinase/response regulator CckA